MFNLNGKVKQEEFGELVGISQQAVSDLLTRKVLKQGDVCASWLKQYCAHLREVAAGRATTGGLDLATERARLAREQADKVAMQNAERRGELAPVAAMEMVLANVGTKVGKILDTIVPQIRRRIPGITTEVANAIENDIAKCRNLAAAMTLDDLDMNEPCDHEGFDQQPDESGAGEQRSAGSW